MVSTICPSLPMRIKALGTNGAADAPIEGPVLNPINRPPPNTALVLRNWRREIMSGPFLGVRRSVRRALDSLADSHISAAAADVPRHGGVDVAMGRVGLGREQRRRGHDLTGLAIAALRYLQVDPGLLDLLARGRGADGLDRGDALAGRGRDRRDARAHRLAVDVHRTRAAQRHAAAEFRAGHPEHIAQHPQQRRVVVDIDAAGFAVDRQSLWHVSLPKLRLLFHLEPTRATIFSPGGLPPYHQSPPHPFRPSNNGFRV